MDNEKIPEIVLASEEVQRRNIEAVISYSKETRKMLREMEIKVQALQNNLMSREGIIKNLQLQIANLQQKLYSSGTGE